MPQTSFAASSCLEVFCIILCNTFRAASAELRTLPATIQKKSIVLTRLAGFLPGSDYLQDWQSRTAKTGTPRSREPPGFPVPNPSCGSRYPDRSLTILRCVSAPTYCPHCLLWSCLAAKALLPNTFCTNTHGHQKLCVCDSNTSTTGCLHLF